MRIWRTVLTVAVIMLGLTGVASLGGTVAEAQEESTQQASEPSETTGTATAAESTTQLATSEQGARSKPADQQQDERAEDSRNSQENTECEGARVIGTLGPTGQDVEIQPFRVTGEKFRLTYKITDLDNSGVPFFDLVVLDEQLNEVGGQLLFEAGTVREIVTASPGTFTIEVRAEDLRYEIMAEDCTGSDPQRDDTAPGPADQYDNDGGGGGGDGTGDEGAGGEDEVIDDTITDGPLPNTGGVPLLGLMFFGFFFVTTAIVVLRPVVRRDS